ncbi:hypothetical protein PpBr36_01315, partial [Pyricularia pennisetigena]|uniref:hypothetical protein n=1 Tax=Pyricularia pennisetigena TaxID=1578925 RepID=UPI00115229F0
LNRVEMLRLPPTAIVIVASEVMAYEERRQTRRYVFQLGKGTKSLSEVESQGPESNSPSSSANVKVDGSDTSGFRDAPAPSPGPSIPGDGGHDEPVEALNNLAQGRSTIFENPSLPNTATLYTLVKACIFGHDFVHACVAPSGSLAEHKVFTETGYSQPSLLASLQLDGNHEFQIYNDEMPAAEQPQTPQNLPESRHRGRLGGAFTAPVTRIGMAQGYGAAAARAAIALVTPTTGSSGERARREPSPPGLNTPGYRGLYGGLENTDDAVLYEAGYRMTSRGSRHLEAESNQEERR